MRSFLRLGLDSSGTCISSSARIGSRECGSPHELLPIPRGGWPVRRFRYRSAAAVEIDPLSAASAWLSTALVFARKYAEGIIAANRGLELNAAFLPPHLALCIGYQRTGDLIKAIEQADKAVSIARLPITLSLKGWIYGVAERREASVRILEELHELATNVYVSPLHFATVYAGMGDIEAWRKAMLEAYEDRANGLVFLKLFPQFEPMRSDSVFQKLLRKIDLP